MAFPNMKPGNSYASKGGIEKPTAGQPRPKFPPKKKKSKQAAMAAVGKLAKDRGISGFDQ